MKLNIFIVFCGYRFDMNVCNIKDIDMNVCNIEDIDMNVCYQWYWDIEFIWMSAILKILS